MRFFDERLVEEHHRFKDHHQFKDHQRFEEHHRITIRRRPPITPLISLTLSDVRHHLYKYGFLSNYYTWTDHGDENQNVDVDGHSSSGGNVVGDNLGDEEQFDAINEMVYDASRQFVNVPNVNANMENETVSEGEVPNEEAQRFYDVLTSANQSIYEGASESRLSISVKLLASMSNWHVPQEAMDFLTQMLIDVCPTKQSLPENCYQVKKLVSKLGLEVEKIDCCVNGCLLYFKEDCTLTQCRICGASRFFMQYHHINEEDASGLIHEQFPSWLKEYVSFKKHLVEETKDIFGLLSTYYK